jgi:hypothetical protein
MEGKTTTSLVVERKPNLALVTKNISNWIKTLNDDVRMHQHESRLTLRDTFKGMSIHEMIKFHGAKRSEIMAIVDLQLVRFLKSINVTNTLTDFQQQELVMHLVENYPHETLNDFVLMFKRVRHGYYGPIYNRIDITVISEYMSKYLEAKAYERENVEREVHSELMAIDKPENFESAEQYEAWKKSWYDQKLTLRDKMMAIEKKFNRMERMGIPADKEKSFMDFRNNYLKTKSDDGKGGGVSSPMGETGTEEKIETNTETKTSHDTRARGTMDTNVGDGTDQNVSVSDRNGSDDVESIQRTGSTHRQQGDGVSQ